MAAPSSTVWGNTLTGSKSTRQGKIGIYTSVSSTETTTSVTVQVWFWSMYSISDTSNSYYFNSDTTTATTLIGSRSISHTVASGSGWSTSNQTKLGESTFSYARGTSAVTKYYAAKFTGIDNLGSGAMTVSTSISVPKLTSYTVSFNNNGGTGSPGNQTKWYGKSLILSSTKPTRNGYSFQGWGTSSSTSTVSYTAGATYNGNASLTLYAIWKANTYQVTYDANGGTGGPDKQTKTHDVTLKLSTSTPTRQNYNFLGWNITPSATTAAYLPGDNYTSEAAITLYAIWELAYVAPRIGDINITRYKYSESSGYTPDEEGTYAWVEFDWESDYPISTILLEWESVLNSGQKYGQVTGTSGTYSELIGDGSLDVDTTYSFTITATDTHGYSVDFFTLHGKAFSIDFLHGGKGASMGKAAELENVFDCKFETLHRGGIRHPVLEPEKDLDEVFTPNTYVGANISHNNYLNCPITSGTFTLTVEGAGEEGQTKQVLTRCSKTEPERYMRVYYQGLWGPWISDTPNVIYVKTASTNLNDYLYTGTYYFNTSYTPINIPTGCVNGWLVVLRADQGAIKQIWYRYGSTNTNDFCTYVRTGNGTTWSNWHRYSVEPDILFTGNSDGTITLSETAANFQYLEIYFTDNNGETGGYTKVYSPNGKTVDLAIVEAADNNTYIRRTTYTVSGTALTPATTAAGYVRTTGTTLSTTVGTNYIKIIRVLGHRP